jgi:hypothetical protein
MQAGGGAARITLQGAAAPSTPPVSDPAPARTKARAFIAQELAKIIAERAGAAAYRHAHPLAGISWASRADDCRLHKVAGILGAPALWAYTVRGRCHFGWLLAGTVTAWEAQVEATSGRVLGVQLGRRRR